VYRWVEGFVEIDEEWEKVLKHPRIYLILGHIGTGKTACGFAILEYLRHKYRIPAYLLNVSDLPIPSVIRKARSWKNNSERSRKRLRDC